MLVTGSSGLIGASLIERFAAEYDVVGFDVMEAPGKTSVDFIHVDITSDASVQQGLDRMRARHGNRIASVVHLAAYYDFSGEPSPKYEAITVRGTERLLRMLQDFEVEQFLFSSTMLVFAPRDAAQDRSGAEGGSTRMVPRERFGGTSQTTRGSS